MTFNRERITIKRFSCSLVSCCLVAIDLYARAFWEKRLRLFSEEHNTCYRGFIADNDLLLT